MKEKVNTLFIFNILFYVFICVHRYYVYDYVPQVLFYMALGFSSFLLEKTLKKNIKELKVYSLLDFLLRIMVVILHFIWIIFKLPMVYINIITIILFITNTLIEIIINKISKRLDNKEFSKVKQEELNKFIEDFKLNKLNYHLIGQDLKENINFLIGGLEKIGESYIIVTILFILLFLSSFFYNIKLIKLFIFSILVTVLAVYIFIKLSLNIIDIAYNNKDRKKKKYIDIISFTIGYGILFSEIVFFDKKVGYFNVSIWVVATILFLPLLFTRFKIRNEFENVYTKYKKEIIKR